LPQTCLPCDGTSGKAGFSLFKGNIMMEKLIYDIVIAAKRRKKHINEISGLVISMCYNEQKSKN